MRSVSSHPATWASHPPVPSLLQTLSNRAQALHSIGLRVVLDVVYNHTFASGPTSQHSVLDKVVPGYYHRCGGVVYSSPRALRRCARARRTRSKCAHAHGASLVTHTHPHRPARRQEDGEMCHSTCCNNTASEHAMMLRLMIDDIVHWARTYKVGCPWWRV